MEIINTLYFILSNFYFLFAVEFLGFFVKTSLFFLALIHGLRSKKIQLPWLFLLLVLIGSLCSDASWIITLSKKIFFSDTASTHVLITLFIRMSWYWHLIQYQALALFLETLIEKHRISFRQKIFIPISMILCTPYLYLIFFKFGIRTHFEAILFRATAMYVFLVITPSLYEAWRATKSKKLPKILDKQLSILLKMLIIPFVACDFLQVFPFAFLPGSLANNYAVVGISTAFLTFAFYFCGRKMVGLRFLNFNNHIQATHKFNFIDDFKHVLEQLSQATDIKELTHITQAFFKAAFTLQPNRTILYLRRLETDTSREEQSAKINAIEATVERFIGQHDTTPACDILEFLFEAKILITDELAFSNFYQESTTMRSILLFLEAIHADIFIPIYEKKIIIAYIVIEREARVKEFYTRIERDQMLVFASYLANIINLLQHRNLNSIIQQEKELREELYKKHQEINQYQESIRSFLYNAQQRKIGIIFYKNRKFNYANQAAKELIEINPNTQEGHPLAKALKHVAHQVLEYKTVQSLLVNDNQGNKIVISGIPNLEGNNTIIVVHYPEISDLIKEQLSWAKNTSQWDYILYLETTQSGKLINHLIPGSGENLLNFKVELLKIALSKKALLLDLPQQDLLPTVEILHHISLKESLHVLRLHAAEKNHDTAIKLFGINAIFGKNHEVPLLESLNNIGTLFIENIHFLDLETQEYLAEFIRYNYYHIFKSDQKRMSNVRIICSSTQNLQILVQSGKFSKDLFNELSKTSISMPILSNLPVKELNQLVDGYAQQAIKTDTFKNLLELTDREKDKLINTRPASLQEFKAKIQSILINKSKKNHILEEAQFDPAYKITDPELMHAARLGKKALKDQKIMTLLWQKFSNQNKIATFLGVNRSSVNRRCKEYNLE